MPFALEQQNRERVAVLLQLADDFREKGHAHTAEIQKWAGLVEHRHSDFWLRLEIRGAALEEALGLSSETTSLVRGCVCVGIYLYK